MKWSTWLKQSNSIILEYDHIPQEQVETFEEQIAEVEKETGVPGRFLHRQAWISLQDALGGHLVDHKSRHR